MFSLPLFRFQVYEGGFKIWECTIDLIKVLSNRLELIKDKCIMDLGCGAGLVGLYCAEHKAKEVHFHDYVSLDSFEVIETSFRSCPVVSPPADCG